MKNLTKFLSNVAVLITLALLCSVPAIAKEKKAPSPGKPSKIVMDMAMKKLRERVTAKYGDIAEIKAVKVTKALQGVSTDSRFEAATVEATVTLRFTSNADNDVEDDRVTEGIGIDRRNIFDNWRTGDTYNIHETVDMRKRVTDGNDAWEFHEPLAEAVQM